MAKNLATIKEALEKIRANIGEVVVEGSPDGATVTVNHAIAGTFPLRAPIRAAKGKVDIEVSAPGHVAATRSIKVKGGDRQQITIKLEKAAVAVGDASAPRVAPPLPVVVAPPPPLPPAVPPAGASGGDGAPSLRRKVGWGLAAGAGAVLIGSVVETVLWQNKRDDFNGTTGCYADVKDHGAAGCSALYDSTQRAKTIAIIGYVVVGALAGGAAALLLGGRSATESATRAGVTTLACAPAFGASRTSSVVTCRLSF